MDNCLQKFTADQRNLTTGVLWDKRACYVLRQGLLFGLHCPEEPLLRRFLQLQ